MRTDDDREAERRTKEGRTEERTTEDQTSGGQTSREQGSRGQTSSEQTRGEQTRGEQTSVEPTSVEPTSVEHTRDEQTRDEQTRGEQTRDEHRRDEQKSEERTTRSLKTERRPPEQLLSPGTVMCPGCGGLQVIKQIYDSLGRDVVFVNAAGCMTLLSVYPFTPFQSSWLYTAMASAPAGAQGLRDALDVLRVKHRLSLDRDLSVVVLAGDGSTNGIGMSATSGALDRGLDFYYVCYDNEGYGNTGQQSSAATPLGARTASDRAGLGCVQAKKDLFSIWAAHAPAYLATVIGTEPKDLARKMDEAKTRKGPKMFIALAPCPTGWGFDPRDEVSIGRLAITTGVWPLKSFVDGHLVHTKRPSPRRPVEAYLRAQGRFGHLFAPTRRAEDIDRIQESIDRYWAEIA